MPNRWIGETERKAKFSYLGGTKMEDIKQLSCGMFALIAFQLLVGLGALVFVGWVVVKLLQHFGIV